MKDLLKEAIAEAKAVKESAIANAKLSLEESFMPRIQSMISARLQNEAEDEYEDDETSGDLELEPEMVPEPEMGIEGEPAMAPEEDEMGLEPEMVPEPAMAPEEDEMGLEPEMSAEPQMAPEEDEDDLNLDELLAELEADEMGAEPEMGLEDDEIDLNELLAEEDESEEEEEEEKPVKKDLMEKELKDAYHVIGVLKTQINEINLLNAKLLFSNKLFRAHELNEGQKYKIIENFDRAKTVREVKLIYSTLAESFNGRLKKKASTLKESVASKPVASTKPSKAAILSEEDQIANRFKHLAFHNKRK